MERRLRERAIGVLRRVDERGDDRRRGVAAGLAVEQEAQRDERLLPHARRVPLAPRQLDEQGDRALVLEVPEDLRAGRDGARRPASLGGLLEELLHLREVRAALPAVGVLDALAHGDGRGLGGRRVARREPLEQRLERVPAAERGEHGVDGPLLVRRGARDARAERRQDLFARADDGRHRRATHVLVARREQRQDLRQRPLGADARERLERVALQQRDPAVERLRRARRPRPCPSP